MSTGKLTIARLTPAIGAVIGNVDLAKPLDGEQIADIRRALLNHQVVFFEDQHLTPVQHRDFAVRFGSLHTHPLYPGVPEAPELFILDNHADNPTDNDAWHTDVTFIETPPMASILYAKSLPLEGGDTMWSNMKLAFERLSKPLRDFLATLDAVHDFARGFPPRRTVAKNAGEDKYAKALEEHPPVVHPVVRTHPETHEDGLFVNYGFTSKIVGLRRKESDALLNTLFDHQEQPQFIYEHIWRPHDLLMWDNRCTLHARTDFSAAERRLMRRLTILGEKPA